MTYTNSNDNNPNQLKIQCIAITLDPKKLFIDANQAK